MFSASFLQANSVGKTTGSQRLFSLIFHPPMLILFLCLGKELSVKQEPNNSGLWLVVNKYQTVYSTQGVIKI